MQQNMKTDDDFMIMYTEFQDRSYIHLQLYKAKLLLPITFNSINVGHLSSPHFFET